MECYPNRGTVSGTLDPLMASAIVFDDGNCRVALVCADLTGIEADSARRVQQAAAGPSSTAWRSSAWPNRCAAAAAAQCYAVGRCGRSIEC